MGNSPARAARRRRSQQRKGHPGRLLLQPGRVVPVPAKAAAPEAARRRARQSLPGDARWGRVALVLRRAGSRCSALVPKRCAWAAEVRSVLPRAAETRTAASASPAEAPRNGAARPRAADAQTAVPARRGERSGAAWAPRAETARPAWPRPVCRQPAARRRACPRQRRRPPTRPSPRQPPEEHWARGSCWEPWQRAAGGQPAEWTAGEQPRALLQLSPPRQRLLQQRPQPLRQRPWLVRRAPSWERQPWRHSRRLLRQEPQRPTAEQAKSPPPADRERGVPEPAVARDAGR